MGTASELAMVVLAAGKGTRMRSRLPKVLHPVCGRSILHHVLAAGRELGAGRLLVVVGHGEEEVRAALEGEPVEIVRQAEPLGTGHAVLQARERLADHPGPILVANGDHPLYRAATFQRLLDVWSERSADLAVLVGEAPDPTGYGRIVRGPDGRIDRIVEHAEASPEVRALREVNLGVYVASAAALFGGLSRVRTGNAKGELFITDLVEISLDAGRRVETATATDWSESLGINDRVDLAAAERAMRARIHEALMREGVTFLDPERTYVDCGVRVGPDSVLEPGVALRGATAIGPGCRIMAGSVIEDSVLGADVLVKPHCWIEGAELGRGCIVGPSAHLRPGTRLAEDVRVGNFVEVKNSRLGPGTKADHLSYIGDADVGAGVTIGCGVITVNYDGERKYRTTIGDGAFVGCNANLIAPVEIEARAYVAAGSTITTRVPSEALAVARARQRNVEGWRARRRPGARDEE